MSRRGQRKSLLTVEQQKAESNKFLTARWTTTIFFVILASLFLNFFGAAYNFV
jgi:hypothetical protein